MRYITKTSQDIVLLPMQNYSSGSVMHKCICDHIVEKKKYICINFSDISYTLHSVNLMRRKKKIITYAATCVMFYVIHSMSFWDSPFIIFYTRQFYYSYSRMWVEAGKLYFTSFILFCITSEVCLKRCAFWN